MLAFARRQELKPEPVDVPQLVRGMTDLLQSSLGPSVLIETRFPLVSKPVLGDANQLEMILLNLTVNARDAMPNGGKIIIATRDEVIRDGNRLKSGSYIVLSVTDSGIGMDEATLRRAMEPFFTTKGPGKGTGLGLSMVHGIAEQSGGWFSLQSKPGEGTTAELWLPVAESQPTPVIRPASEEKGTSKKRSLVILAVDDDRLVLTNTVAMLDDLGHRGIAVPSGKEALEILQQRSVDLVITDYAMPHMTGLELAKAIKNDWPNIPVVIASGFAEMNEKAGDISKLAKPFTEDELAAEIENVWGQLDKGGHVVNFRAGAAKPS